MNCANCGANLAHGATTCAYCRASVDGEPAPQKPLNRTVQQAVNHWARGVRGAPRRLADLVTAVDARDEVIERVVTEIVRREVSEARMAANAKRVSRARLDPAAVDPYSVSLEELRAASEHVASCWSCGGSGQMGCPICGASGSLRCGECGGGGRVPSPRSNRMIKCRNCGATGQVDCDNCGGEATVDCTGCDGSGRQAAWLLYHEKRRWTVAVAPDSPVFHAHGQLREARLLDDSELDAFSVVVRADENGPVPVKSSSGRERAIVSNVNAQIDHRLERIGRQQYLKLAVVRRDATYEMCGTTGTVVMSGRDLLGSHTADATGPITRRFSMWIALGAVAAILSGILLSALRGASPYFESANGRLTVLWLGTMALAVPAIGVILRSWRPGFRRWPVTPRERVLAPSACVCVAIMTSVGLAARPSVDEVGKALAKGDTARARVVVEALKEKRGPTPDVLDAEDTVVLAEADQLRGDERLKLLGAVVKRGGRSAEVAARLERQERLAIIRQLFATGDSKAAIAAIERWFGKAWNSDAEVAEEFARGAELMGDKCADDPCRYVAAWGARAALNTPKRTERLAQLRASLIAALNTAGPSGETLLARVRRCNALAGTAAEILKQDTGDEELAAKAKGAASWAAAEKGKVPILGSDVSLAPELLGGPLKTDGPATWVPLGATNAYLSLDAQKMCRGVYVVGGADGSHAIKEPGTAERVLSQAVGHPTTLKRPQPESAVSARWLEGTIPVVARWNSGVLSEVRIGDAQP